MLVVRVVITRDHIDASTRVGRQLISSNKLSGSGRVDMRAEVILHLDGHVCDLRMLVGEHLHGLNSIDREHVQLILSCSAE